MSSTANRVAVNTFAQYTQLVVNVIVGLFSVRIILNALGASDYGIYDLIGGIVAFLGFIRSSLAQTSLRFISVGIGHKSIKCVADTFRACFWLHVLIGLFICLILVLIGLFLFNSYLNIPIDRIPTAKAIFYFMVFNLFLSISITPFSAIICAHERFVFISCIQILDSVLKLAIAFSLISYPKDKLLLYGWLMVCITIINAIFYIVYSGIRYRGEISIKPASVESMKGVTSFAGWTMLDVLGSVATRQGYAILLNLYFGTIVNATFAIARQIEGHIYSLSASVIESMKPQIMKSKGSGDMDRVFRLSLTAGKFGFLMMSVITIPLIVMMPDVLQLWLKSVPEGTVLFARLMILACMIEQLTRGLVYANQAVGNIKWFSISVSSIRFLALPLSWLAFKLNADAYVAIVVFLVCETIGSLSRVFILSKISSFSIASFVHSVILQIVPLFLVSFGFCSLMYKYLHGIVGMVCVFIFSSLLYCLMTYFWGLTDVERGTIKALLKSWCSRLR